MGFETAVRDCLTSISKVRDTAVSGRSDDPSPLSASWRDTRVAGPVAEMCALYIGSGCSSTSQKKSLFSFNSFSGTSNCLEFYAVLFFQLAKGGGGVLKCDELITIKLSVTIVIL